VEVYNNSGITGLANETAARLQDAGWNVVGADNWYGDIPANTVYYPERLRDQAKLLAADLGISRLHTAVPPMRFDRLTVTLTGPTAPATDAGRRAWERLLARPESAALMLDFDGTLAPIVPDPQRAFVHPDAPAVLERLGTRLRAVAIVTGRPVEEVLRLGGFA